MTSKKMVLNRDNLSRSFAKIAALTMFEHVTIEKFTQLYEKTMCSTTHAVKKPKPTIVKHSGVLPQAISLSKQEQLCRILEEADCLQAQILAEQVKEDADAAAENRRRGSSLFISAETPIDSIER